MSEEMIQDIQEDGLAYLKIRYRPTILKEEDIKLAEDFNSYDNIKHLEDIAKNITDKYDDSGVGGLVFLNGDIGIWFKEMLLSKVTKKSLWNEDSRMLDHLIENAFEHGNKFEKDKMVYLLWDEENYYIIDEGKLPVREIAEGIKRRKKKYDEGDYSGTSYLDLKEHEFVALYKREKKIGTMLRISRD